MKGDSGLPGHFSKCRILLRGWLCSWSSPLDPSALPEICIASLYCSCPVLPTPLFSFTSVGSALWFEGFPHIILFPSSLSLIELLPNEHLILLTVKCKAVCIVVLKCLIQITNIIIIANICNYLESFESAAQHKKMEYQCLIKDLLKLLVTLIFTG